MADTDPPAPEVDDPRAEPASRRISAVWLVPLLALVIALVVAWRAYDARGPLVEIVFDNAAGIEAGQTTVRFRDVVVGVVEKLDLTPNLKRVVVTARINKEIAHFLDADAKFWVVRPSVSAQGVSGIETVISGVYIAASWDDRAGPRQELFEGLPRPPLTPAGAAGLRVQLRAPDGGSMSIGAPVLYKRIQVGQVEDINLTPEGDVLIDLFINAPNQVRVTGGTRFWNASGFSIELGGGGASLNVDSLLSLLQGGVSFDTVGTDRTPAIAGQMFELYPSEGAARQNLFEGVPGERLMVNARFDGSVEGLNPGAPVRYHGVDVGEVTGLQAVLVGDGDDERITLQATLALVPPRLGVTDDADQQAAAMQLLDRLVARGMRARLGTSGLLSQSLFVELVDLPDAEPATIDTAAQPYPLLPTVPSDISGVASSAQGLLQRLTALPLEQVVQQVVSILGNVNAIVASDGVRKAPEDLGALIADLRGMVDDSGIKEAPAQIAAVLASAKALVDQATQAQLVANLNDVLATAKTSLASIGTAADGAPAVIAQIEALSAKANALPLDELVASATRLVDGMDAFVKSEGVANLPGSVEASLDELRGIVTDLRTGGAIENVNATLASVRQIADQAGQAELVAKLTDVLAATSTTLGSVDTATDGVPAVVARIDALVAKANALPLDQLVASATSVTDGVDTLVRSESVTTLPASLQTSLAQLRGIVADLRDGGAIENVNATLASVRQISDELAAARLTESVQTVITEARSAIGNVNGATLKLPGVMGNLDTLSANLANLPLDQLVTQANQVLGTADSFLASPGVTDVPPKLAEALEELRAILAELREGGAAANVNDTLASASRAADAVTAAADDLPALMAKLTDVANRADAALATVSPESRINRDTLLLLQEVRDAARSVSALVTALERRPNSVLFGR